MSFEEVADLILDAEGKAQRNCIGVYRSDNLHPDRHSGTWGDTNRHVGDGKT